MTSRDKRTLRLASIAVGVYLGLFFGLRGWNRLEARRAEYQQLLTETLRLKRELQPYENRVLLTQKLKETFHLDPQTLSRTTLVAQASAALQKAAASSGVQVGPIRESSSRASAREIASMQVEGGGPVPAVMGFLHRLQTLGYPLVVDALQLTPDTPKPGAPPGMQPGVQPGMQPGMLRMSLTIVILNFDQWKEEKPHA